jgi:hypothetical protein
MGRLENGLLMTTPAKKKALLASGTLNPHPEAVRSDLEVFETFAVCILRIGSHF